MPAARTNTKKRRSPQQPSMTPTERAAIEAQRAAEAAAHAAARSAIAHIFPPRIEAPPPRVYHTEVRVEEFCRGWHRLPGFQRPAVWSSEKSHAYAKSVLIERRFPGLFVLRVRPSCGVLGGGTRDVIDVLDGQQRLLALGAILQRGTIAEVAARMGERIVGAAPFINPLAQSVDDLLVRREANEQPAPEFPGDNHAIDPSGFPAARYTRFGYNHVLRLREYIEAALGVSRNDAFVRAIAVDQLIDGVMLPCLILNERLSREDAKEVFRSINTPGVPISPDELDRLLDRDD